MSGKGHHMGSSANDRMVPAQNVKVTEQNRRARLSPFISFYIYRRIVRFNEKKRTDREGRKIEVAEAKNQICSEQSLDEKLGLALFAAGAILSLGHFYLSSFSSCLPFHSSTEKDF